MVPIDVPRNVSISWYGPEGQISKGEKYELMDPFQDAANVFIGPLIINSLENSDNLTEYYCTVEFRVNDTSSNQRLSDFVIPGRKRSQNVSLIVEGERISKLWKLNRSMSAFLWNIVIISISD